MSYPVIDDRDADDILSHGVVFGDEEGLLRCGAGFPAVKYGPLKLF